MLEIIPMKYNITDKKYDSSNFDKIHQIKYIKETDSFFDSNTNKQIDFDFDSFVKYYTDYHIGEAKLMKGNLKYYSNKNVMINMCYYILSDTIPNYNYKTYFVLDYDNNIQGFIRLKVVKYKNRDESVLHISELYIIPRCRNQGLAISLLNYAKTIAIQNNINYLQLAVQKGNLKAIKLYKKIGFEVMKYESNKTIGSQE